MPVTTPPVEVTDATGVELLVQTPPAGVQLRADVLPTQTMRLPEIEPIDGVVPTDMP